MSTCARAKSINLLLYDGTLRGVVGIEDSAWRGEMYSAPRDSMEELLGSGACFLVPYLDEALFLMELVGITVFCEASADAREQGTRPSSTRIDVADVRNRLAFGKRVKRLAVQYAIDHGAQVTDDNNYAVLKENGEEYFLNPQRSRLSADWTLVLNDTDRRELVILRIPPGSLRMEGDGVRGLAYRRGSRSQIDLHISADGLKDRVSGVDFSKFLVARVAY